jgi:CubicO group peptidase (beta-lactamase class C family)
VGKYCVILLLLLAGQLPMNTSVDELFRDYSGDVPGAAVIVIHQGKVLYEKAYGLADLHKKIPCTTHTDFRLASVTKQFTAMSILMLAQQKKLSLDDSMTKYFPEFPDYGKPITIRHMLSHRSGLPDYEDLIPNGTTIPVSDRNALNLLRTQTHGYFPAGSEFRYSNSGYCLLSLIVEKVSGMPFSQFLQANIFQPLGMTRTVAYEAGTSQVSDRAYGYALENERFIDSDQSLTSSTLGDGGVYSNVEDLYKWDQALYTEKLISHDLLESAFQPVSKTTDMKDSGYGYGWYVTSYKGARDLWHYGETCGFTNRIDRFPDRQFTVIVLTNRRDANIGDIGRKIADIFGF